MKSRLLVLSAGTCLAAVLVSVSIAAGGNQISNAPVVVSGVQYFGNTANMPEQGGDRREYWRLNLVAGDAITVNFSESGDVRRMNLRVYLMPAGITDFNVLNTSSAQSASPQDNGKGQLTYTAPTTGVYPLMFRTSSYSTYPGPFDFVAYIRHGVKVFIPAQAGISRTGSIAVQVKTPDGNPITDKGLKITLRGSWTGGKPKTLGKTTAANGLAKFKLDLPASAKGQTIRIRAIAQGANYIGALSVTRAMKVR